MRMVYDNLKAVVETIFIGKERRFNRRFMALANHYLFEPVACTPASGWEKGQVENQVGNIREWLFTPLARFSSFEALNDWLATRCRELAQRKHPATPEHSIADCFVDRSACFTENHRVVRWLCGAYVARLQHLSRDAGPQSLQRSGDVCRSRGLGAQHRDPRCVSWPTGR